MSYQKSFDMLQDSIPAERAENIEQQAIELADAARVLQHAVDRCRINQFHTVENVERASENLRHYMLMMHATLGELL